jgi:hypothetical protein
MDNEIVEVLAQVSEDIKWYNLRYKIYALLQDPNFMNNISIIQTHIHKIEDDLNKNILSNSIRNIAINILQLYYNKIYDFEKMYSITKELVKNAENESINKKYNFNSHLINLSNMLYATLHLEKLEEMPPILEKITNLDTDSELQKIDQFKIYSQYELLYRLNTKNFNDIDSIISNIELGIKKYKSQLSTKIVTNFQFNIIVIYFISKNYSKSQSKINTLLKTFKKNENNNQLFLLITIIEVMCLYSLKSNDTAESLFRSWSRNYSNLAKEEILFTYILQFFKKITMPYDNFKNNLNQITYATNHVKWDQLKGLISEWGSTYRTK